ncbi:MAG: PASTA domain-containing protein [Dysgonamonadaceae bacterium]|jgi:beta-lactam-binding protein with PASTA domain|nr:PASTA domain-containing protein [Dysgonamonadaceae bacterium]MDD3355947.1 PASTA domain-containing protein [Dysgonamonadaceae bacterium]MDD3726840.1 PASTA domain-containing protein [Dysgonamonadaceae bacterium]MDD4246294.1 PASTA domain-containing protein [Dysgonamonadaceae bacterium]MDD4605401.1 PASTA domain-containing protein [Dysgonamonadaceae bacterium]
MNAKKAKKKNPIRNSIIKNILLIIATGIALLIITLVLLSVYTRYNKSVDVPQVKGLQLKEAKVLLKSQGLKFAVVDSLYDKDAVPGAIIEQVPSANSRTKSGREVFLTIYSTNPPELAVPGLVDYSHRQAEALLTSMGFDQLTILEVPSEYKGLVKAVEYRGKALKPEEKIPAGSPLTIIVGSGILSDSLEAEREFIVPSSQIKNEQSNQNRENKSQGTQTVDESFF